MYLATAPLNGASGKYGALVEVTQQDYRRPCKQKSLEWFCRMHHLMQLSEFFDIR